MDELETVVARLSEIVEELLELEDDDFAARFALEKERDGLRARAEAFHQRKDEHRSTAELMAEHAARTTQLEAMKDQLVNRATQASSSSGRGGGGDVPIGAKHGGNLTTAGMQGMGADKVRARISEIEQELAARRAVQLTPTSGHGSRAPS